MNLTGNTILITGGTSGIGLALAKRFVELGNRVIAVGRREAALDAARAAVPGLVALQGDVADPASVAALHERATRDFPELNVLINCAGIMRKLDLQYAEAGLVDLTREVDTNLSGTIWMDVQFLPHLKRQRRAAIVNVSSGLAFVPMPIAPVYSATKAAVHAFTLSLRMQLKNTGVQVFELAPPGTDTPMLHGDFTDDDIGGLKPMSVDALVQHTIDGMQRDVPEIRPGLSNLLKFASRVAPALMLKQIGRSVDLMHRAQPGDGAASAR